MWRWIVGVLVVILFLVMGTCYWGYKKLTAGGASAEVTIKQSPERIFGMFADPDSLRSWSEASGRAGRTGTGMLHPGDTLTSGQAVAPNNAGSRQSQIGRYVVREVQSPTLFVIDGILTSDSGTKNRVVFTRRDSLVAMGDSTRIISTFTADMMGKAGDSLGKVGTGAMGVVDKLMVSIYRTQMEQDLRELKRRLEKP